MHTGDARHTACARLLAAQEDGLLVPAPVVVELDWMLRRVTGNLAFDAFLASVEAGAVDVAELRPADYARVRDLCQQYQDLGLGFVDASVVAIAERLGQRTIATLDRRHFSVVRPAGGGHFDLVPGEAA